MHTNKLQKFIKKNKKEKELNLFVDIETLEYNKEAGREKPTEYKNMVYSVAVSFFDEEELKVEVFPNFNVFFESIFDGLRNGTGIIFNKSPKVKLIYHNGNKYDNHFMLWDILYYYPFVKRKNLFLKNTEHNEDVDAEKIKGLNKEEKQGIILESHIKSANNLEMNFFLYGVQFQTVDNFVKTSVSLDTLGKKLYNVGVLGEDDLKTSFDYVKYDKDEDMTNQGAKHYCLSVFNHLNESEMAYIINDVVILGYAVKYYSTIFYGFDYSKMTFTANILDYYNQNRLTSYQLLHKFPQGKKTTHVKYTDYQFTGLNFYDYLKPFYRGGLNFYNQFLRSKVLTNAFSMDLNSSYPYVMYNEKIPTYLSDYEDFGEESEKIEWNRSEDFFYLYRMTKWDFNNLVLDKIDSIVLRQMIVKYYTTNEYVNINDYTLRIIEKVTGNKIDYIRCLSYVGFATQRFGSREQLAHNYKIKSEGKQKQEMIMHDPYTYEFTENENQNSFSAEEINNSKVLLNGLYGIPALRPYYHLFRLNPDHSFYSIPQGFKNSERNIVFSIFVTAVAFYNLITPLSYLTQDEIDQYFIYCDTDSLYLKKEVYEKTPAEIFDPIKLGAWDIEHEDIKKMYVLNHKKYVYYAEDKINVACGGIPQDTFDKNMDFETFVNTQFKPGIEIHNQRSIFNNQGTISIYPSTTLLDEGRNYFSYFPLDEFEKKQEIIEDIKKTYYDQGLEETLYFETAVGTLSIDDVFREPEPVKGKNDLFLLKIVENHIKNEI